MEARVHPVTYASKFWTVPLQWPGETVFIIGGGPSVTQENVDKLRGRHVVVINSSYGIAPWADYLIFSDHLWWGEHRAKVKQLFSGVVVNASIGISEPGLNRLRRLKLPGLMNDPAFVFVNYTTFTAALNMTANLIGDGGRIILLGADGKKGADGRSHHHKPHKWTQSRGWSSDHRKDLSKCMVPLSQRKIEVINSNPDTAWRDLWPTMPLEEILIRF